MTGIARTAVDERIGRAAERSRDFAATFNDEYPRVWAVAYALVGDRDLAEEIAMEAFSAAFSSWRHVIRAENRSAYLRRIVLNLCRSKWRRRKVEQRANAAAQRRGEREKHQGWAAKHSDARMDVWDALVRLPARQRACVVLRYYADLTDEQVAETLGCSIGTVKSHLHRARRSLETMLDPAREVDA
jgi:RNA polymerase sigma-70 factor (sigma-E family)